jgi:hypothetical protein
MTKVEGGGSPWYRWRWMERIEKLIWMSLVENNPYVSAGFARAAPAAYSSGLPAEGQAVLSCSATNFNMWEYRAA